MPETKSAKSQETKADETLRRRLAEFVEKKGLKQAALLLEISPATLGKLLGNLPVKRNSLKGARVELDKLAPVDASDSMKGGNNDAQ